MLNFIVFISTFFLIIKVFQLIWTYPILWPLTLLSVLTKTETIFSYIIKFAEIYFLTSLTALYTLGYMSTLNNAISIILTGFLTAFLIFLLYASGINQKERTAKEQFDHITLKNIKFDYFIALISAPLFIIILFFQDIATFTPLIWYFYVLLDWILGIAPIVKIILLFIGFLSAIPWLIQGFVYILVAMGLATKKVIATRHTEEQPKQEDYIFEEPE